MGGDNKGGAHGHGSHGHGDHGHGHHHHHHVPRHDKSVINYEIFGDFHHVEKFKSPDYKIYKVENAPYLVETEKRLAKLGLKDPWLRNEVWRYDPQFGYIPPRKAIIAYGTSGMKWGLVLAVGTILLQTAYSKMFGKGDAHGHHGKAHH